MIEQDNKNSPAKINKHTTFERVKVKLSTTAHALKQERVHVCARMWVCVLILLQRESS